jgi:hypothetical protein
MPINKLFDVSFYLSMNIGAAHGLLLHSFIMMQVIFKDDGLAYGYVAAFNFEDGTHYTCCMQSREYLVVPATPSFLLLITACHFCHILVNPDACI